LGAFTHFREKPTNLKQTNPNKSEFYCTSDVCLTHFQLVASLKSWIKNYLCSTFQGVPVLFGGKAPKVVTEAGKK